MDIRSYRADDAHALAAIYRRAVTELGPRGYTPAQVVAWMTRAPAPERLHEMALDGRLRLVAVDEADQPVAFFDLKADGHVDLFYCSPATAGRGVGSLLYATAERAARERGITRLTAEASELSYPFFLARGFVLIAKREFVLAGVDIHNYAVQKLL
jgi:putative acetyltransferase